MLLTMKALTGAARTICYATAEATDRARRSADPAARQAAQARADLLTPIAKAFSTDVACEVAALGVQVHGGMGYIEETGAAQHYRDARITAIYEGTNGIQAIDLVTRKLPLDGGAVVRAHIDELDLTVDAAAAANVPGFGQMAARLGEAVEALAEATLWIGSRARSAEERLAGATPYLRLYGIAAGGCGLARAALAASRMQAGGDSDPAHDGRIALARFYAENLAPAAGGLAQVIIEGAGALAGAGAAAALAEA
jgi:hypothetical protein